MGDLLSRRTAGGCLGRAYHLYTARTAQADRWGTQEAWPNGIGTARQRTFNGLLPGHVPCWQEVLSNLTAGSQSCYPSLHSGWHGLGAVDHGKNWILLLYVFFFWLLYPVNRKTYLVALFGGWTFARLKGHIPQA